MLQGVKDLELQKLMASDFVGKSEHNTWYHIYTDSQVHIAIIFMKYFKTPKYLIYSI